MCTIKESHAITIRIQMIDQTLRMLTSIRELWHTLGALIFPKSSDLSQMVLLQKEEERKKAKYAKENLPGGSTVSFIPLVVENLYRQCGEMGKTF